MGFTRHYHHSPFGRRAVSGHRHRDRQTQLSATWPNGRCGRLQPASLLHGGEHRWATDRYFRNGPGGLLDLIELGLGATGDRQNHARCAYDRAGLGWSEPSPYPRDAQHIAAELHTLLQNSQTPGPYVLVGWSFGGLYVRAYASQYREEVAGMVLLDSSSPEQCTSTPAWQAQCASSAKNASIARILARFGIMRLIGLFQPATGLPGPQNGALLASFSAVKDWDAQNAEFLASSATNAQVLSSKTLGAIPLFVLTATDHGAPPDLEQQWQVWQSGFTALSTNSVQQVVPGATHNSLLFNSTDAKVTVEAILKVVEAARTGEQLKP